MRKTISENAFWFLAELARLQANSKGCRGALIVYTQGLTQAQAAAQLGCQQSTVGRPCASIKRVWRVIEAFITELDSS